MTDDVRSDAALLAAAALGDDGAYGVLVRRYVRAATFLSAQLLGDRDEADDVVQEAFAAVHRKARAFDADQPFGPWLFAFVRRLAANRKARDRRRERLLRLWGPGTVARPAPLRSEEILHARLDAAVARQAMDDLSPMQRACFELVAVRDLPTDVVAAMHGISESTVRQHVFRARVALRGALEPNQSAKDVS